MSQPNQLDDQSRFKFTLALDLKKKKGGGVKTLSIEVNI